MEYVLTADGLTKKYGRTKALSGLSINVPKGEIYGLVGRNGAGKTTLLRIVCGLASPTEGRYSLFGVDSNAKGRSVLRERRRMGAVVEAPSIYLDMSAEDNLKQQCLALGLPSYGVVPEMLELVGLSDAGKKRAGKFSLGMKQRLGIAVALIGSPDLLILDEPMNGLDPQGIVEIRELILRLNRERRVTVLMSSHILDELSRTATYYGFIDGGRMIKEISAGELERSFRKCVRAEVNDTKLLTRALDGLGVEYDVISDREADIFGEISISKLTDALGRAGCELLSLHERDESLEGYFMNLVGRLS